jgi:hypothetical protein
MKYFQFIRAMELFHEIMLMRLRLLGSRIHIGWLYVQLGWIQVQNFVLTGRFIDLKKLRENREKTKEQSMAELKEYCAINGHTPQECTCQHPLTGEDCSYDEMAEAEIERLCDKDD